MAIIQQLASAEASSDGGIIGILGIDWMMLTFQIIAFLILVWFLSKFVYPWLVKSIDDRQAKIESAAKAASEAQVKADEAEKRISRLLADARSEADGIIAIAKEESTAILKAAEDRSLKRAQQLSDEAKKQIEKDILAAKRELHNETIDIIAVALEKLIGKSLTVDIDNKLISNTLKDIK